MDDVTTAFIDEYDEEFLDDLRVLVAQPSVSATGDGVSACANLLSEQCEAYGFDDVQHIETERHPCIVARAFVSGDPSNNRPTILIFGHYDVQPVDAERWTSPPFEPTVRDGPTGKPAIYGRGVSDNKGQLFAHLCAVKALRETTGLPVNVTLLLEGEEESLSPSLANAVRENADLLAADLVYVADAEVEADGRAAAYLGIRGMLPVRIEAQSANRELHAGLYGGPMPNAAQALAELLASLHDDNGRVTIDNFYEPVRPVTDREQDVLDRIPFDEAAVRATYGIRQFPPGPGDSYHERVLYQPSITVAGVTAGYDGDGYKSSIPPTARALLTVYLVPDQEPDMVFEQLAAHVDHQGSPEIEFTLTRLGGDHRSNRPTATPLDSPYLEPIEAAITDATGASPVVYPRIGGGGPMDIFEAEITEHIFIVPYGSPGSRRHGPNENLSIEYFQRGIRTSAAVLTALSEAR